MPKVKSTFTPSEHTPFSDVFAAIKDAAQQVDVTPYLIRQTLPDPTHVEAIINAKYDLQ